MKTRISISSLFFSALCSLLVLPLHLTAQNRKGGEFYQIRVYHFKDAAQEKALDNYMQQALIPALHRLGLTQVGAFKAVGNDTAADKRFYLIYPLQSLNELAKLQARLRADKNYRSSGRDFIEAPFDHPVFERMESILTKAFPMAPRMQKPVLSGPLSDRVYELRSYESPTEALHWNKVHMFNEGGEISLFSRLGFNAVFYSSVVSGAHMPNLMYMTSFDNMDARNAHWKAFGSDPFWKDLSSKPEYQHNVSHIDIVFLHPAAYSDF